MDKNIFYAIGVVFACAIGTGVFPVISGVFVGVAGYGCFLLGQRVKTK